MASHRNFTTPGCPAFVGLAAALGLMVCACSADQGAGKSSTTASEDERGSVGVPPPPAEYCTKLGYVLTNSQCKFPDGTGCEQWSFYRGECGQPHSYCSKQGGTIASKTEDKGRWTAVYGVCSLNGKVCEESAFFRTGRCE